jgi:hypothetical protein
MGAEIPRYRREKLERRGVSVGRLVLRERREDSPFLLDDLAEAVEHAIVVLTTSGGGSSLQLPVWMNIVLADINRNRVRAG